MRLQSLIARAKSADNDRIFIVLFALAVFCRLIEDLFLNRLGIHSGELFPVRKLSPFSPYPVSVLYFEWAMALFGAAVLISKNRVRLGATFVFISYSLSLSQMFQNQKFLIWIVSGILLIAPQAKSFLKWQVIIIYLFSAFQKIFSGFADGEALRSLFNYLIHNQSIGTIRLFILTHLVQLPLNFVSSFTIVLEFLLPFLLLRWPRIGFKLVLIMHVFFSVCVPDTWAFTITMIAIAYLFLPES